MSKQAKIVDYTPKSKLSNTVNLSQLLNQQFIIEDIEFTTGNFGEVAIVTIAGKTEKYRTSSKVLLKQLHEISEYLKQGMKVRVTLKRVKRYYSF